MKACTLVERCKYKAEFEFSKAFERKNLKSCHFFSSTVYNCLIINLVPKQEKNLFFKKKKSTFKKQFTFYHMSTNFAFPPLICLHFIRIVS